MTRYRFWSDTNQQQFEMALHDSRLDYQAVDYATEVTATEDWIEALALDLGATVVEDDDYVGTSGLFNAGHDDMAAFSTRSNPPPEIRDMSPQQNIATISQTIHTLYGSTFTTPPDATKMKNTKRRKTWSQP